MIMKNTAVKIHKKNILEKKTDSNELKRWEEGAKMASKDEDYLRFHQEWSNIGLEIVSYNPSKNKPDQ